MAKYHVNPESGVPGQCSASKNACPFGGESRHYPTPEAAVKGVEQLLKDEQKGILRVGKHKLLPSFSRYQSGTGLAIEYYSDREGPYGNLTVNISGLELGRDEIVVNSNLYDKEMLRRAEEAGFFTYTGQEVKSGYVTYPIAKLSPAFHALALKENQAKSEYVVPCDADHYDRLAQTGQCRKCGGVE